MSDYTNEIEYAKLKDGTPVIGHYDTDGEPMYVSADWQQFRVSTDGAGFVGLDPDRELRASEEWTMPGYGQLRELVTSGVVEEMIQIGRRFAKSAWARSRRQRAFGLEMYRPPLDGST